MKISQFNVLSSHDSIILTCLMWVGDLLAEVHRQFYFRHGSYSFRIGKNVVDREKGNAACIM